MTPKEECERLMVEMKEFAKQMLRSHGEFHPFGGTIRIDDAIVHASADAGTEFPRGDDLVEILADSFHAEAMAGNIRAAAIVANVRVTPPGQSSATDAIRISLDHVGGYAAHVFFPYRLSDPDALVVEKPFASKGLSFAFSGETFGRPR
jgi:hypothetical protein